jgi:hypothetical protein
MNEYDASMDAAAKELEAKLAATFQQFFVGIEMLPTAPVRSIEHRLVEDGRIAVTVELEGDQSPWYVIDIRVGEPISIVQIG